MSTLFAVLRVCAFFGVTVFALTYWIRAPWERSEVGRNIMTLAGGAWLLLGIAILHQTIAGTPPFHPAYWGEGPLAILGYLGINVAFWWRWVMLLRVQAGTPPHEPGT